MISGRQNQTVTHAWNGEVDRDVVFVQKIFWTASGVEQQLISANRTSAEDDLLVGVKSDLLSRGCEDLDTAGSVSIEDDLVAGCSQSKIDVIFILFKSAENGVWEQGWSVLVTENGQNAVFVGEKVEWRGTVAVS